MIERPASVIKELVENSIDAGAKRIEVEFRKGGTSLMRIEDDGQGMSRDDASLALERHATSKIRNAEDLDGLLTMGFRGEALPSIASVSRFQLQTRESGSDEGTDILIDGGRMVHTRDCGMPTGTRITVSKLFNTVPARRKFLKSVATESAHIVHCLRLYALAHPEIGFTLIDDGRILFQSPACAALLDRVTEIFGKQIASGLIPLDIEEEGLRLRGLIGKPTLSRSSRHEMLFFVNDRPVENKTLSYALVESYYGHMAKGRFPVAFLFLDIAPELVDVNVHPAKREIRFREEAKTRGFAVRAILQTLREESEALQKLKPVAVKRESPPPSTPRPRLTQSGPTLPKETTRPASPSPKKEAPLSSSPAKAETELPAKPAAPPPPSGQDWNYLGWAQSEFAVFDTPSGVMLLNAGAARQRILYERMLVEFASKSVECQKLLLPQPVEFDPVSAALVEENLSYLQGLGLELAPFGRNFFRIEGVPNWLEEGEAEGFLKEIVALLRQGSLSNESEGVAIEMIAKRAALRGVRPRGEPSSEEIASLVAQLFACEKPLSDPEGRPTLVEFPSSEIDRRFLRKPNRRSHDPFL